MAGSQDYAADPRNAKALIYVNGALVPREAAVVSIFDAGFTMGDGVWEGIRLHKGVLLCLDAHLDRLMAGAAAIGLKGLERAAMVQALHETLAANAMTDGAHLRLMVTRGLKTTANQDPRNALGPPTLVITAEYKQPPAAVAQSGLALATVSVRCTPPSMFDMRLNSHSRLPLITALLQAIEKGADEAIMLDPHGFISTCNATNFFFVVGGEVRTSRGQYCFNGITRGHVIDLCRRQDIPIRLGDFDPAVLTLAGEAFVTGTSAGLLPVGSIDGRQLTETPGPLTLRLRGLYADLMDAQA